MPQEGTEVAALYVQCSFDMRDEHQRKRGGFSMSDCCRKPAISAVVDDDGSHYWRCLDHEGELRPGVFKPVSSTAPVKR